MKDTYKTNTYQFESSLWYHHKHMRELRTFAKKHHITLDISVVERGERVKLFVIANGYCANVDLFDKFVDLMVDRRIQND